MSMRSFNFVNVAILSVLVGSAALAFAQEEKPQEEKPAHQEEAKPEPKPNEAKPPHQDEAKPPQDKQTEKMGKPEERQEPKPGQEQSHEQAMPNRQDHPEQAHAQPAGKGGHIPDDKFRASFGRSHTFTAKTVIVEGRPQFQYSGYSFQLVDTWPVGWAYTDDCYIDYIDGEYFLFDLLHPGVRIAVFVVM
jgi:outer membrane biosynthesis protein TonB